MFSHEELVCKMAADPDGLDLDLAKAVYDEMLAVVEKEAKQRHILTKMASISVKALKNNSCRSSLPQCLHVCTFQSVILWQKLKGKQ